MNTYIYQQMTTSLGFSSSLNSTRSQQTIGTSQFNFGIKKNWILSYILEQVNIFWVSIIISLGQLGILQLIRGILIPLTKIWGVYLLFLRIFNTALPNHFFNQSICIIQGKSVILQWFIAELTDNTILRNIAIDNSKIQPKLNNLGDIWINSLTILRINNQIDTYTTRSLQY